MTLLIEATHILPKHKRIIWNTHPNDKIVGSFGITEPDGYENIIPWRVSGYRKDKRHGVINPITQDKYSKSLFESMFKDWNN